MNDINWEIRVPILKSKQIMKQMAIAIGIPFGILILLLLTFKAWYGLVLVVILLVLSFIFVAIIYRGTYDVVYELSKKGISQKNFKTQKKKVEAISTAAIVLGGITGNPTAMGAGILSMQKTDMFLNWKRVRKVKYLDKEKLIMLYGGIGETISLFCLENNYGNIKNVVYNNTHRF